MITEYVKGTPYFTDTDKKLKQFQYLDRDILCDVLIIGGGIDGAITAYYFAKNGIDCVLIEKNRIGYGNTSCATALLEYQLDDHGNDLTKYLSKEDLVNAYNLGLKSLSDIDKIMKELGNNCHYSPRPTLIYTQKKKEVAEIEREFKFRRDNNFSAELVNKENNEMPFLIESGVYCENGGAEFNPYLFTKQMVENAEKLGAKIYENTEAIDVVYGEKENTVFINYGIKIKCKKVISATGYNTKLFTKKRICNKFISYTIVTSPIDNFSWHNRNLLHDNSDPYHYIRLSPDNRIIIGGEDIPFKKDTIKVKVANKKYELLNDYIIELFPELKGKYSIDYKFCGAFSSTLDNLAVIGPTKDNPNLWYMLGYGANGIIDSIVGAQMLVSLYKGIPDPNLSLFSPDRQLV